MQLFQGMNKENTVLMVIDMINCCAHEHYEIKEYGVTYKNIRKMAPKLEKFIDIWREQVKGQVVMVDCIPWVKECLPENINELYKDPNVSFYTKDKSGFAEEFYKIKPQKGDIRITKNTYSAFSVSKLKNELKKKNIKHLVVSGIFADGCVLATVVDGFTRGYNFVILKDLIESNDKKQGLKKMLLENVYPYLYGKVMDSTNFIKEWRK